MVDDDDDSLKAGRTRAADRSFGVDERSASSCAVVVVAVVAQLDLSSSSLSSLSRPEQNGVTTLLHHQLRPPMAHYSCDCFPKKLPLLS